MSKPRMDHSTEVESSNIASIGYNSQTNSLFITFVSGKEYEYYDVPFEVYEGLRDADSVGSYFWKNVRNASYGYSAL